jgi:DNA end-binding protein Ku
MARPIWTGTLSFGLLNVPVSLMTGSRTVDLHFRMLDSRSKTPIRYERVNAETGDEVPWKDIVKAFEYKKGSYVVLNKDDLKSAASEGREAVEVEAFVDAASIGPEYYEKPYVLVPGKKAEKGYVLLRETLKRTGKIGIARVVIRTREYLSAVMPKDHALILMILRFPQELVDVAEYTIPQGSVSQYRIAPKELDMAEKLIESMSGEWEPGDFRDEFRERLQKVIAKRMKSKGLVAPDDDDTADASTEDTSTNVVDFMALLEKSLSSNKRTPAKKTAGAAAKPAVKKTAKKSAAKKAARKITKKVVRKTG